MPGCPGLGPTWTFALAKQCSDLSHRSNLSSTPVHVDTALGPLSFLCITPQPPVRGCTHPVPPCVVRVCPGVWPRRELGVLVRGPSGLPGLRQLPSQRRAVEEDFSWTYEVNLVSLPSLGMRLPQWPTDRGGLLPLSSGSMDNGPLSLGKKIRAHESEHCYSSRAGELPGKLICRHCLSRLGKPCDDCI